MLDFELNGKHVIPSVCTCVYMLYLIDTEHHCVSPLQKCKDNLVERGICIFASLRSICVVVRSPNIRTHTYAVQSAVDGEPRITGRRAIVKRASTTSFYCCFLALYLATFLPGIPKVHYIITVAIGYFV